MTRSLSAQLAEIPLYLLPRAIAELIRKKGEAVYRISVVRTHWHHYNVSVRTKRIKRELAPVPVAVLSVLPDNTKQAKKAGRRCAA
jgi:hypothetical protein